MISMTFVCFSRLGQDVTDGANMPQFVAAMWALARACYKVTSMLHAAVAHSDAWHASHVTSNAFEL